MKLDDNDIAIRLWVNPILVLLQPRTELRSEPGSAFLDLRQQDVGGRVYRDVFTTCPRRHYPGRNGVPQPSKFFKNLAETNW